MTINFLIITIFLVNIIGCVTAPKVTPPEVSRGAGIYHRVAAGDTLWRISQMYQVDLDEIVKANRIPDVALIEKGQMIFIPGAASEKKESAVGLSAESNFSWPVKGKIISYFGSSTESRTNKGIDIQVRPADNISASSSGRVVFCDTLRGYGKTLIIEHPGGISTVYSGDLVNLVSLDDRLSAGNVIAKISGKNTTLLHFEVRRGYRSQNPLYYLP